MFRVDFREFDIATQSVSVWSPASYHDRATAEWHADTLRGRVTHPDIGLWDVIVRETNETKHAGGSELPAEQTADVQAGLLEM